MPSFLRRWASPEKVRTSTRRQGTVGLAIAIAMVAFAVYDVVIGDSLLAAQVLGTSLLFAGYGLLLRWYGRRIPDRVDGDG